MCNANDNPLRFVVSNNEVGSQKRSDSKMKQITFMLTVTDYDLSLVLKGT